MLVAMSISPNDVIRIAQAEIGYPEKASNAALDDKTANAGSGNYTKYARDLAAAGFYNGNKNGFPWCDVFVDWCAWVACGRDKAAAERLLCQTGDLGAGTEYSARYYQQQGRFDKTACVGDQVFFLVSGSIGHTGLVESVTATTVTTIEGNSGDKVQRHTYLLTNGNIAGYGHPRYDGAVSSAPQSVTEPSKPKAQMIPTPLPLLTRGAVGLPVRRLQMLLTDAGCQVSVDGDFGSETLAAVKLFQNAVRIDVDGEVGPATWGRLINGG